MVNLIFYIVASVVAVVYGDVSIPTVLFAWAAVIIMGQLEQIIKLLEGKK